MQKENIEEPIVSKLKEIMPGKRYHIRLKSSLINLYLLSLHTQGIIAVDSISPKEKKINDLLIHDWACLYHNIIDFNFTASDSFDPSILFPIKDFISCVIPDTDRID